MIKWKYIDENTLTSINLYIPLTIHRNDMNVYWVKVDLTYIKCCKSSKEAIEYCNKKYRFHTEMFE